jgi:hypothetical protein
MPWFVTVYNADGSPPPKDVDSWVGSYGGYLFARDLKEAKRFAKKRGLNEGVMHRCGQSKPYTLPSEWRAKRKADDKKVMHALCWVAHMALQSGVADANELLGDQGLVHEYLHMRCNGTPKRKRLIEMAKDIERRIPGLMPPAKAKALRER